jgi:SAM-dependent methyltransferase
MTDSPGGTYAERHLLTPAPMRWSHGARLRLARRLVAAYAGQPLLDYGCGDGTFLYAVRDLFPQAVGAEVDPYLVEEANLRLGSPGLRFVHTTELEEIPDGAFQAVVCMEVLEHCIEETAQAVIALLHRLTAPTGRLVVSVPIETGPTLLAKQAVRAMASFRGIEGYRDRERYSPREMLRMVMAGRGTPIPRPEYRGEFSNGTPNRYHGHKGFNWRAVRDALAGPFRVEETRFSPLGRLPWAVNSQAWFVCSPR